MQEKRIGIIEKYFIDFISDNFIALQMYAHFTFISPERHLYLSYNALS